MPAKDMFKVVPGSIKSYPNTLIIGLSVLFVPKWSTHLNL